MEAIFNLRATRTTGGRLRILGTDRPDHYVPGSVINPDPIDWEAISTGEAMRDSVTAPTVNGIAGAVLWERPGHSAGQLWERAQVRYSGSTDDRADWDYLAGPRTGQRPSVPAGFHVDSGIIRTGSLSRAERARRQYVGSPTARHGLVAIPTDGIMPEAPARHLLEGSLRSDGGQWLSLTGPDWATAPDHYVPIPPVSAPLHAVHVGRWDRATGTVRWDRVEIPTTVGLCSCNSEDSEDGRAMRHLEAGRREDEGEWREDGRHYVEIPALGTRATRKRTGKRNLARANSERRDSVRERMQQWARAMRSGPERPGRKSQCNYCADCSNCSRASRAWAKRMEARDSERHAGALHAPDASERASGVRAIASTY